jgi:hypothetical protein
MIVPEQLDYFRKYVIKKYVDEVMKEIKEREKENAKKVN